MTEPVKYGMRPVSAALISNGTDPLGFQEEGAVLLRAGDFDPAFFDLKSGLAGEIFQKASNYALKIAIVLDGRSLSERFRELVYEHRRHPLVRFFDGEEAAVAWLRLGGQEKAGQE